MKKWLFLVAVLWFLVGIALLSPYNRPVVTKSQVPQTTENPIDTPTPKVITPVQPADSVATPATTPSSLSDNGTVLVDMQSSDYPSGTVFSDQFKPTTFWTWNVSYTCDQIATTTRLPSGNFLKTGPNLQVDLMIILPTTNSIHDATPYHSVNRQETGSGSYSVTETADQPFYFRVSGNCQWHIVALDNGAPQYEVTNPSR